MLNTFFDDLERGLIVERKALTLIRKKFPSIILALYTDIKGLKAPLYLFN
jgi:hypothetical protein